jgi:hypothetical protein
VTNPRGVFGACVRTAARFGSGGGGFFAATGGGDTSDAFATYCGTSGITIPVPFGAVPSGSVRISIVARNGGGTDPAREIFRDSGV